MRFLFSVLVALILASKAYSEALPAYYNVSNVAPDDVLNIRQAPSTAASIIGKLGHEDTSIEVVAFDEDKEWGQVNIGEMAGWVSLRFLTRQPGQIDDELPSPLVCAGTEPFWTLDIAGGETAQLSRPGETPVDVRMLEPVTASNRTDRYAIFGQGGDRVYTFIFHRDACSDGMSDRAYGMSVDLFLTEEKGVSYVTGCCNLK
ncbi:SH3 domain-containing protein [Roseovarius rhodophyticola]|uniref:SH3 domain-containing protein n=1 Tax=Roseovarius rhodophyticola TaxID=3080827 RepID=A0ABZ2TMX1_9RHOB|nr:SH3 domain-containing protein [Roseovarius sp. W115]MDV2930113.1 SH3 domain-containing protein [Roseovarius sp. W115]